jgi:hypothetical protein
MGGGSGRVRWSCRTHPDVHPRNGLAVQVWRIEVILAGDTDEREEGIALSIDPARGIVRFLSRQALVVATACALYRDPALLRELCRP